MKPKEKAEELVLKYLKVDNDTKEWFHKGLAKKCALIAVDELFQEDEAHQLYWAEVEHEIRNL